MPCCCNHKVERSQPKIQCAKCNELFHMECVNILPADAEFLLNSQRPFLCKVCTVARRNSIRSPPPPVILDESVVATSVIASDILSKEIDAQRNNNLPQLNKFPKSGSPNQLTIKVRESFENDNDNIDLKFVLNEIAALRAENARAVSLINTLHEDKKCMVNKIDCLQSELYMLKSELHYNEIVSAITTLTAEIKDLRANVCAVDANTIGANIKSSSSSARNAKSTRRLDSVSHVSPAASTSAINNKQVKVSSSCMLSAGAIASPAVFVNSYRDAVTGAGRAKQSPRSATAVPTTSTPFSLVSATTTSVVSAPPTSMLAATPCAQLSASLPAHLCQSSLSSHASGTTTSVVAAMPTPMIAATHSTQLSALLPSPSFVIPESPAEVNPNEWTTVRHKNGSEYKKLFIGCNDSAELGVVIKRSGYIYLLLNRL